MDTVRYLRTQAAKARRLAGGLAYGSGAREDLMAMAGELTERADQREAELTGAAPKPDGDARTPAPD
jgi:hypothetical protein